MEENNNVLQEVVEPEQPETDISVQAEGEPEVNEEVAKPQQTPEQNAFYAKTRREMEEAKKLAEETKKDVERERAEKERLLQAAKLMGYSGNTAQEIADQIEAAQKEITVDELISQREKEARERADWIKNNPEYLAAKQRAEKLENELNKVIVNKHLEVIKKYDPELKAENISELGETFLNLMSLKMDKGEVKDDDVILAYEMSKLEKNFGKKPTPPSPGAVNNTEQPEKEYYTEAEADRLTREDLRNPTIYERYRRSMAKWKT